MFVPLHHYTKLYLAALRSFITIPVLFSTILRPPSTNLYGHGRRLRNDCVENPTAAFKQGGSPRGRLSANLVAPSKGFELSIGFPSCGSLVYMGCTRTYGIDGKCEITIRVDCLCLLLCLNPAALISKMAHRCATAPYRN